MLGNGVLRCAFLVYVAFSLESLFSRCVLDDSLTARGVDEPVRTLYRTVGKPTLLSEASALVGTLSCVISKLVVTLELRANANVV